MRKLILILFILLLPSFSEAGQIKVNSINWKNENELVISYQGKTFSINFQSPIIKSMTKQQVSDLLADTVMSNMNIYGRIFFKVGKPYLVVISEEPILEEPVSAEPI